MTGHLLVEDFRFIGCLTVIACWFCLASSIRFNRVGILLTKSLIINLMDLGKLLGVMNCRY